MEYHTKFEAEMLFGKEPIKLIICGKIDLGRVGVL